MASPRRPPLDPRNCDVCGTAYQPRRRDARTCGDAECQREIAKEAKRRSAQRARAQGGSSKPKTAEQKVPKPTATGELCAYCHIEQAIGDEFCSSVCARRAHGVRWPSDRAAVEEAA